MPNFIFAYHGGTLPKTEAEGQKMMTAWNAWYAEMGDKVMHEGGGVGKSTTVSKKGTVQDGGLSPLMGFTIVSAKDHAEADEMAKGCPMLDVGGSVEVAQIMEM